MPVS
ncbi:hypothetical protein YPPY92_0427, partial [Yersinia pestis PY-92]|jgi:hypothetical protein